MKKLFLMALLFILMFTFSGCGSMGAFRANNTINVELSRANFNIVAKDLEGSAMQGYLFGLSAPQGSDIVPLSPLPIFL